MDLAWYLPLLIFCARICDVSLGTLRTILVVEGRRFLATGLGFIEVSIWVLAVGGVVQHLSEPLAIIAYSGGFATGTLVGMTIERRIALGHRAVRAINPKIDVRLVDALRNAGYRVTRLEGEGRDGPVEVVFTVIRRRHVDRVREIIAKHTPGAFVTVGRVDRADGGGLDNDNGASRFTLMPWARTGQMRK